MRLLFLILCGLFVAAGARGELYIAKKSRSPNGRVAFAINYTPTDQLLDGSLQCCFVNPKTRKPIGDFFYLEGVDANEHPGVYTFDNYNVFDYVWSADSTHIAIVHNMRHSSQIYPFRREGSTFKGLEMPDLNASLEQRLRGTLQQDHIIDTTANRWTHHHRLIVTISEDAQVGSRGNAYEYWREHSLRFIISFDTDGKPHIEAMRFRVRGGDWIKPVGRKPVLQ